MSSKIEIRRANLIDAAEIHAFIEKVNPHSSKYKYPERWHWLFIENPFRRQESLDILIAVLDGQIIGQACGMRVEICVGPQVYSCCWGIDYFVLDQHQGLGMGKLIFEHYCKHYPLFLMYWIGDDDCLKCNTFSKYLKLLQEHPSLDVIYSGLIITDERLTPTGEIMQFPEIPEALRPYKLLEGNPFPKGGACMRKSIYERMGVYDEIFTVGEDYEFWVRAVRQGINIRKCSEPIYLYRKHKSNLTLNGPTDLLRCMVFVILSRIVERFSLEELFPMLNWQSEPKRAMSIALSWVGVRFAAVNAYERALQAVEQAEQHCKTIENAMARCLIYYARRDYLQALEQLEAVMITKTPACEDCSDMYDAFKKMIGLPV